MCWLVVASLTGLLGWCVHGEYYLVLDVGRRGGEGVGLWDSQVTWWWGGEAQLVFCCSLSDDPEAGSGEQRLEKACGHPTLKALYFSTKQNKKGTKKTLFISLCLSQYV